MGTAAEHFNIRWKNYPSVLHSSFRTLLEEERLVDVTLACDGGFVKCHRIILTACSSYFENILNEFQTERHMVIFMKDVKMWELKALIDFMYNGEVSVKQNRLAPLVRAAEALHIRGLSNDTGDNNARYNEEEEDYDNYGEEAPQANVKPVQPLPVRRPSVQLPAKIQQQGIKRPSTSTPNGPPKLLKINKPGENPRATPTTATPSTGTTVQHPKVNVVKNHQQQQQQQQQQQRGENGVSKNKVVNKIKSPTVVASEEDDYDDRLEIVEGEMVDEEEGYEEDATQHLINDDKLLKKTWKGSPNGDNDNTIGVDMMSVQNAVQILDPPMTEPVVDAADRANRLQKATDLALSGITVRQAAAHYGIPRTTLCAYMKRKGLAGKRLLAASGVGGGIPRGVMKMPRLSTDSGQLEDQNEFQFLSLADLVEGTSYEGQEDNEEEEYDDEQEQDVQQT